MKRLLSILSLCLVLALPLTQSQTRIAHLGAFDELRYHFGIQMGYTQSKFDLRYTDDDDLRQTITGTTSYYSPGYHIHVIGDMRLNDYFNLRLLPGFSIISRDMDFSWSEAYTSTHWKHDKRRTVESVYAEMPVELKFRAKRYADFRPYLTTGISWGYDFASLLKNKNNDDESIIRLNPVDMSYTYGVGFDFFLLYVKFAIELKMAFGITDLLVPDDDYYTRSTDYMKSRTFLLSFTFEGDPRVITHMKH